MYRHGTARGLAHALLEVRQDLITDAAGIEAWTQRLVPLVAKILAEVPDLNTIRHYGSRCD